ncbi:PAS domain-containing protein [Candidatus Gracilibacteria bacterium]|nr:PAS domain-containing protein [Candidatus Gracilibacteria bacterium]
MNTNQDHNYLDAVVKNTPFGIAILTLPNFECYKINTILADINGVKVEDHIGKTVKEVLPAAAELIVPRLQAVADSGKTSVTGQFTAKLREGEKVHTFEDTFFPIKNDEGQVIAVGGIIEEITDLEDSKEALHSKIEELEQVNKLMVGRENKMSQLKEKVKELEKQLDESK